MNPPGPILGWDVGGANIKVARIDRGASPTVLERAFPLWREFARLPSVLSEQAEAAGPAASMAVTMTAELADCFATKREGVAFVIDAFRVAFPASALFVYGVDGRFRSADEARDQPEQVAAANWMASATMAARSCPDALFIDVGSTTTDVIPIAGGEVVAAGHTDISRLGSGELVYTGVLRTPVCAIVRHVPLPGGRTGVAAEHFAIAADVYRWLGRIDEPDYTCETPDGRGRSRLESGARLARMVCADLETLGEGDVTTIADHVARAQVLQVVDGIRQVLRQRGAEGPRVAVVAGAGVFLARESAIAAGLAVEELAGEIGSEAARSAPAAAVAVLLSELLSTAQR